MKIARFEKLAVCLVLIGAAGAAAAPRKAPEVSFDFQPPHALLAPGGSVEIRFQAFDKDSRPLAGDLEVRLVDPSRPTDLKMPPPATIVATDAAGRGTYCFRRTPGMLDGLQAIEFRHPGRRAAQRYYVDLLAQAEFDAFQAVTEAVRFNRLPAHLLFIGDSLTDLFRGQNYVDKLAFLLSRRFGAQVTLRNAGVGGDMITRVWDRMTGAAGINRVEMYQDLFTPRPTHVFFFLGHNDSKLTSGSGYREAVVAPEAYEDKYRLAIRKVQAETDARVIVLSATSSVAAITEATAANRRAAGKAHNWFGKPEALGQYNAIARRVAAECGAEWLDVYEPTRRHKQKASLFTADGVHVSNLGNRLLAMEILKFLAAPGGAAK